MRRITYAALAGCMLLLATSPARAAVITGNELLEVCEDRAPGAGYALCLGYVTGIADLAQILTMKVVTMIDEDGDDAVPMINWCRPTGVTNAQLVDVVVRDLRAHPEDRHMPALALIMRSLRTSLPCR
jgi:hypothetical protein